jgi:two-component system, LuxR family, response regulator FixJ
MTHNPTVFVVDDDEAVRSSLRWLIESAGQTVETYASAAEFLAAYGAGRPGCLLLDVRMPLMGGLDLQKKLTEHPIPVPIIFISAHATVPVAVRAMRYGAVDFFTKPFNNQALLDRMAECVQENAHQWAKSAQQNIVAARLASLSTREREVMDKVVVGRPNKIIAAELKLSIKTVEAHRARMMEKMGAASLAELLRMALTLKPR